MEGFDVMFHVSTLLPFSSVNRQQIERKRHIGNDIAVLLFLDSSQTFFIPSTITSKYNHIYGVVQFLRRTSAGAEYRVAFASKSSVPPFGPLVPREAIFASSSELRQFLLTKSLTSSENSQQ